MTMARMAAVEAMVPVVAAAVGATMHMATTMATMINGGATLAAGATAPSNVQRLGKVLEASVRHQWNGHGQEPMRANVSKTTVQGPISMASTSAVGRPR